jgi:hypothetical protein
MQKLRVNYCRKRAECQLFRGGGIFICLRCVTSWNTWVGCAFFLVLSKRHSSCKAQYCCFSSKITCQNVLNLNREMDDVSKLLYDIDSNGNDSTYLSSELKFHTWLVSGLQCIVFVNYLIENAARNISLPVLPSFYCVFKRCDTWSGKENSVPDVTFSKYDAVNNCTITCQNLFLPVGKTFLLTKWHCSNTYVTISR